MKNEELQRKLDDVGRGSHHRLFVGRPYGSWPPQRTGHGASSPFSGYFFFIASSKNLLNCGMYLGMLVLGVFGPFLLSSFVHKAFKISLTHMLWDDKIKFCSHS